MSRRRCPYPFIVSISLFPQVLEIASFLLPNNDITLPSNIWAAKKALNRAESRKVIKVTEHVPKQNLDFELLYFNFIWPCSYYAPDEIIQIIKKRKKAKVE